MSSRASASPPNLTSKGLSLKQRREARLQAALRDNLRRRKAGDLFEGNADLHEPGPTPKDGEITQENQE